MARTRTPLLAVSADSLLLNAFRRDLIQYYDGNRYRVVTAQSPSQGLHILQELTERGQSPALVVSDQRLPGLTGLDFLDRAEALAPKALGALFTDGAGRCGEDARPLDHHPHHHLARPWQPPQKLLYPVLVPLLKEWRTRHGVGAFPAGAAISR